MCWLGAMNRVINFSGSSRVVQQVKDRRRHRGGTGHNRNLHASQVQPHTQKKYYPIHLETTHTVL